MRLLSSRRGAARTAFQIRHAACQESCVAPRAVGIDSLPAASRRSAFCRSPRSVRCWALPVVPLSVRRVRTSRERQFDEQPTPAPAHESYDPASVRDMATLVLMARSANAAGDDVGQSFWRACTVQAQRLAAATAADDYAKFVEQVAQAGYRDDELMYNFGDAMAEAAAEVSADTTAVALRVHELLRFRNDRVLQRLEKAFFDSMQDSRATASSISLSLLSLARLHHAGMVDAPTKALLDGVARMVSEHIAFFSTQQLAEVLEAYGIYRIQGDRQTSAMLSSVAAVFAREASSATGPQCAAAAFAFAKCRSHNEQLLMALAERLRVREARDEMSPQQLAKTLYGFAKFSFQDTAVLDLLSIEARRHLYHMDVPLIGSILSSLAKAGISSPVLTGRAASKLRKAELQVWDSVSVKDLTNIAMAFGKLQAKDEKLFGCVAEAMLRKPDADLRGTSCSNLVNICHAFTKIHFVNPGLFGIITQTLLERFEELTEQEIVKFLHAASKVELVLPPSLADRFIEVLTPAVVQRFGVFELLKLATALRRLGMEAPALESHIGAVLPNEVRGSPELIGVPSRRPTPPKRRTKSLRKRKWTW